MIKLTLREENCKGCSFCIVSCPKKAISLSGLYNQASYEYVKVDPELCIKCGTCYTVCPDGVFVFSEE